jgi:Mg2+/Co2+ transporter CorC
MNAAARLVGNVENILEEVVGQIQDEFDRSRSCKK